MIRLIDNAAHFVYIESQFFVSDFGEKTGEDTLSPVGVYIQKSSKGIGKGTVSIVRQADDLSSAALDQTPQIGTTGQAVTAVFAQAPGALQLLPAQTYAEGWLRIEDAKGQAQLQLSAGGTAYDQIYRERKQWWGLVNEAWLSPKEGWPIEWGNFTDNVDLAEEFHAGLVGQYHPNTYVIYGADTKQPSFEKVVWRVKKGLAPSGKGPNLADVSKLPHGDIRGAGSTPEYVGGKTEATPSFGMGMPTLYETSHWELHCLLQDGKGDGTVPQSSGAMPLKEGKGKVRQQFKLTGFGHEPAYKNADVQQASLFSINKIAGLAKVPA